MGFKTFGQAWARNCSVVAIAMTLGLVNAPMAQAQAQRFQLDIPAENTAKALNEFSQQTGIQILFPYDAAAASSAPALKGSMTREEALNQLLANTGLEVASVTESTITLRVKVKNDPSAAAPAEPVEVVVTGSRIRNAHPTSPVHTVTRKDIERSGYSQIGDVMRSLPENFSGGQNPGVFQAVFANENNANVSNASTINIRGLGSDASLVLVNGHRLPSDSNFQGSDISGVPLAAVERIEVVTDGASALYGSDAVAGVANIILRKDYDGAEVSGRWGIATQGGGFEQTYSALKGFTSTSGSLLVNLEYSKQDAVTAADRDFAVGAAPDSRFLQPFTRRSIFVSASHDFGSRVTVSADVLVGDREAESFAQTAPGAGFLLEKVYTPSFSVAPSIDISLAGDWKARWIAVAGGSRNRSVSDYSGYTYRTDYKNAIQYTELTFDGTLARLPTGKVRVAFGGGYRHERFDYGLKDSSSHFGVAREVGYVFGELYAPLVEPSADRTGLHELELSLSARGEDYSDFGKSTNPRIGIRYVPANNLTLRGTWGKSFKAPTFWQLGTPSYVLVYDAPSLGYSGGPSTALVTFGGNDALKPETSTSWTVGGDFQPTRAIKVTATYFNIDYDKRIVQPIGNFPAALSDPNYAPFVELNPSAVDQAALIASGGRFADYSSIGYDPAHTVAIIQDAYQNATSQTVKGVDLGYTQSFDLAGGSAQVFANGTWLKLKQQTSPVAPNVVLSGTIFSVPTFKARGGLSWQNGGFSATGIANYISEERDTGVVPHRSIASWLTVDANASYRFEDAGEAGRGLTATLAISNLFDRDPPFAYSSSRYYAGLNYDSTNTSILGRFVSLTLSKAW